MSARKKQATSENSSRSVNFEQAIDRLNQIVEKMEHGELTLEEALKYFEEGSTLIRSCQKTLEAAQQKVEILTKEQGREQLKPYEENE